MKIDKSLSDYQILAELGSRIKACRIRKACTQAEFAALAGVSKGTVSNAENGESIQMSNLLRILRELDSLNSLEVLLPDTELSPMELIRLKEPRLKSRVRKGKSSSAKNQTEWKWGDEK